MLLYLLLAHAARDIHHKIYCFDLKVFALLKRLPNHVAVHFFKHVVYLRLFNDDANDNITYHYQVFGLP